MHKLSMHMCRFCEGMGCYFFAKPKMHWKTCWGCKGHGTVPPPSQPAVIICRGFNGARKSADEGKKQHERDEKKRKKKAARK